TPPIGLFLAHRVSNAVRITLVPSVLAEFLYVVAEGEGRLRAGAAGVFPLGFRRQAVHSAGTPFRILGRDTLAERLRFFPGHVLHRVVETSLISGMEDGRIVSDQAQVMSLRDFVPTDVKRLVDAHFARLSFVYKTANLGGG